MKRVTLTLVALLINVTLGMSCAGRAVSLRMLDRRAEYEELGTRQELSVKEAGLDGFRDSPVPVRTRPKVAAIWIHSHEMANHDYFWGGWMSVVVEADQWVLSKPGEMRKAPGIVDVTTGAPRKTKMTDPGARTKKREDKL